MDPSLKGKYVLSFKSNCYESEMYMSDANVRIGLIGAGRIGIVHSGSIVDTKGADLVWVCDPFVENAERLGQQYGAKVSADPLEVINSGEVDAILIASPTPTHVDLINAGLDAGLHIMCEKPIDLDIARVESLRDKANNSGKIVSLGFNRRYHPEFEEINRRVLAGEIGKLEQLVITSRDPGPAPRAYIAVSGGIFRDMTIHDFDMARYFIPKIVEVSAVGANSFSDDIKAENDFDSVSVTMKGANEEIVTIINSRRAVYGYDQRLEAFGSDGMLIASNATPTNVRHYNKVVAESANSYIDNFLDLYAIAYRRELALFVEAVRTGVQTTPTFDDGRAALILADAATESARTGKAVKVNV